MAVLIASGHAQAANYPLEIIQPRPNLDTKSRFYKAYPGIPYEMRMGVIGGDYPFRYELTTAPSGMTIDANTGVITWPNPTTTGSPHTVTARVTDLGASGGGMGAGGTQVSVTWTITVTTSGFIFVDAVKGHSKFGTPAGDGSISNPFLTMKDFLCVTEVCPEADKNVTTYQNYFVYFRAGTYTVDGPLQPSSPWGTVSLNKKPVVWMAYPNENAVLNFALGHPLVITDANDAYFSGFEMINQSKEGHGISIAVYSQKARGRYTFWKLVGHGMTGNKIGTVSSHLYIPYGECCGEFIVFQNNEFYNDHGAMHAMVTYETRRVLWEDNYIHDSDGGGLSSFHGISIKGSCRMCAIRGNRFKNIGVNESGYPGTAIWIYDQTTGPLTGDIEVSYNDVVTGGYSDKQVALSLNESVQFASGQHYIYRNTFQGRVVLTSIDRINGPYNFYNNVIVNADASQPDHIYCGRCTARNSQISARNNLTGIPAANLIDTNGNLTSGYTSLLGTRGYQLALPTSAPKARSNPRGQ